LRIKEQETCLIPQEHAAADDDDDEYNEHWYYYVPKPVERIHKSKVTIILWNQKSQTYRTISNNKPDITVLIMKKRTYLLIDVAISGDRNVIKRDPKM
jgi:hypothetical protein